VHDPFPGRMSKKRPFQVLSSTCLLSHSSFLLSVFCVFTAASSVVFCYFVFHSLAFCFFVVPARL